MKETKWFVVESVDFDGIDGFQTFTTSEHFAQWKFKELEKSAKLGKNSFPVMREASSEECLILEFPDFSDYTTNTTNNEDPGIEIFGHLREELPF